MPAVCSFTSMYVSPCICFTVQGHTGFFPVYVSACVPRVYVQPWMYPFMYVPPRECLCVCMSNRLPVRQPSYIYPHVYMPDRLSLRVYIPTVCMSDRLYMYNPPLSMFPPCVRPSEWMFLRMYVGLCMPRRPTVCVATHSEYIPPWACASVYDFSMCICPLHAWSLSLNKTQFGRVYKRISWNKVNDIVGKLQIGSAKTWSPFAIELGLSIQQKEVST